MQENQKGEGGEKDSGDNGKRHNNPYQQGRQPNPRCRKPGRKGEKGKQVEQGRGKGVGKERRKHEHLPPGPPGGGPRLKAEEQDEGEKGDEGR